MIDRLCKANRFASCINAYRLGLLSALRGLVTVKDLVKDRDGLVDL